VWGIVTDVGSALKCCRGKGWMYLSISAFFVMLPHSVFLVACSMGVKWLTVTVSACSTPASAVIAQILSQTSPAHVAEKFPGMCAGFALRLAGVAPLLDRHPALLRVLRYPRPEILDNRRYRDEHYSSSGSCQDASNGWSGGAGMASAAPSRLHGSARLRGKCES
jgi:hypothetical protein